MKINSIRLRGITTFQEEGFLDLAALGPGIIAVTGPNGAGKTTLLESIPGAIYRSSPSYGSIAKLATTRDARIELEGENGAPFKIRLDADSHNKKMEATLCYGADEPAGPGVTKYDLAVADHFPPLSVFLASSFASQTKVGSILKMDRAGRRELFGRLLGLERLDLMATAARARATATETEMAAFRAALDALAEQAEDVTRLERELAEAKEKAEQARQDLAVAKTEIGAAMELRDRLSGQAREAERSLAIAEQSKARATQAEGARSGYVAELIRLGPILERTEEIRAHAKTITKAKADLSGLEAKYEAAKAAVIPAGNRLEAARRQAAAATAERVRIEGRGKSLESVLFHAAEIREISAKIKDKNEHLKENLEKGEAAAAADRVCQEAVSAADRSFRDATSTAEAAARLIEDAGRRLKEAEATIAGAEAATKAVPCSGSLDDATRASCAALKGHFRNRDEALEVKVWHRDNVAAIESRFREAETNKELWRIEFLSAGERAREARERIDTLRTEYRKLNLVMEELKAKDRSAELDKAETELNSLEQSREPAMKAEFEASAAVEKAERDAGLEEFKRDEYAGDLSRTRQEIGALEAQDKSTALADAERQAGILNERIRTAIATMDEATAEAKKAMTDVPVVDKKALDESYRAAAAKEKRVEEIQQLSNEAGIESAQLETRTKAARETKAKADALRERLAPMERDLADWRWLARGLGREGVQALELDAAGPQVSALTNELLAEAYGTRFQLRLETQAAKADGKGVKETFEIIIADSERGREGTGEDFSGGEQVIIGEALGLAVGIFHSQSSGVNLGTVARDETVGALDPESKRRYLSMIRNFLRVGRVHQLLFVCHDQVLADLADVEVRIENGKIEVRT
jgi:exonuclease SbcC